jgi:hypothetical protein
MELLDQCCVFFENVSLAYIIVCPVVIGGCVDPASQLLCSYYRLQEIQKYDHKVDTNGTASTPNVIEISPVFLELNHADGQTDRQTDLVSPTCINSVYTVQRKHKKEA